MISLRHCSASNVKIAVLAFLTLQNAALALTMRYSRSDPAEKQYLASAAVITNEVMKASVSFGLVFMQATRDGTPLPTIFKTWKELLQASVPAFLYLLQNNLQYVAVSNLDAATYQVTCQLKVLTTAVMTVMILYKPISFQKWVALFVLTAGVALVQLSMLFNSDASAELKDGHDQNHLTGLLAVIMSCFSSGLAGVYMEQMLKSKDESLWVRNVQLASCSIIVGLAALFPTGDVQLVISSGFFHGFTKLTVAVIVLQAGGGIITAIVIKLTDNIVKVYATSLSIILSCLIQYIFMDFAVSGLFVGGVSMVLLSVYLYSKPTVAGKVGIGKLGYSQMNYNV